MMTFPVSWPMARFQALGVFVNRIDLESPEVTSRDSVGAEVTDWTPQMFDVPCVLTMIPRDQQMAAHERRYDDRTETKAQYIALIPQTLADLATTWRALVNSVPYNIIAVERNPLVTETRLWLEAVNV